FSSKTKRRRRGDPVWSGRISRSAGSGYLPGGGSRLCKKALGPLVAASRRNATTCLTGGALAIKWDPSSEPPTAAARRALDSYQGLAIVRQVTHKEKRNRLSGFFPGTPPSVLEFSLHPRL